ncbi:CmcJ/NvfI family oxidoreductase [Paraburkholderia sp. CNPSo 3076]|uniref:CmcJ/NvfI family oxidoreductase n=1 Tax=Paraburkholderia sp. CNPSo 3076 TaxID=2940936 RepID=UPI002255603C|nr:CmcJ/NvfI family oxidoreductase [Paraburkholderia sp. CNPSo 3076]MCX5544117.1 CmcJ/NvfI family oxidoreductase [Paraburkholderia sp. CNPSo 3076]
MDALLLHTQPASQTSTVEAELNYLAPGNARPVNYTFEPPAGTPWSSGKIDARRVTIHNARPLAEAGEISLDRNGFQLVSHRSAVSDFSDDTLIRCVYRPEAEALLRNLTGAEKVIVFDHTIRDSANGSHANPALRLPARRVHNDQTFVSGPRRVLDHLDAEEAQQRLQHRFAIVNLWRPLRVVEQLPLALCDARSIAAADLVPSDHVYRDQTGETFSFLANPQHRWYFFPRLRPDEVLLLKIYDSLEDGTARLTAHTAFEDPTSQADAPARRSIELRALLFWPASKDTPIRARAAIT